jgi:hypothetical protein
MRGALLLLLSLHAAHAGAQSRVSPAEQRSILGDAARLIEQRYVDERKAGEIAAALRKLPAPASALPPAEFAKAATAMLRGISGDGHLGLSYSEDRIAPDGGESEFSGEEMERWYGAHLNHGIEKIERLPGNIMLLDIRVFPPVDMGGDVFSAAMTTVAEGAALIIDLRANGGGEETSNLLMGYLLAPGTEVSGSYNRPSNARVRATTPVWVPGRRFGEDKPVFVLTSARTFSAAERVAYDLQAAKRAVIVGERSGGGANPFEYRRIADHFAVNLPESMSINPITGSNWEGVGVKPDVEVPAADALQKAIELATKAIASPPAR